MIVPPFSTEPSSAFRAAGFIATRTLGWSPGVRMSTEANWIWNAETPCTVPAGARISAGKSGRVARSLPSTAVALVNRSPVNCIPSPESPANRMTTRCFSSTCLVMHPPGVARHASFGGFEGSLLVLHIYRTAHPRAGQVEPIDWGGRRCAGGRMRSRRLGSNGPEISVVGFGAWEAGGGSEWGEAPPEEQTVQAIGAIFEDGIDWID